MCVRSLAFSSQKRHCVSLLQIPHSKCCLGKYLLLFLRIVLSRQIGRPGWLSRYSGSLRAGQFGGRIPEGASYSFSSWPPPGLTQPPTQCVPGLVRESTGRSVVLITKLLLAPDSGWVSSLYLRLNSVPVQV